MAATAINEEMKQAAVRAIASLARRPVPDVVNRTYSEHHLSFGPNYFIPKPVDPRLITDVSMAVARAAMESGVARRPITDWKAYDGRLRQLMGQESKFSRNLFEAARANPKRVVYAEGTHPNVIEAAVRAKEEGICRPILLGNDEKIRRMAADLNLSLEGVELLNLRIPTQEMHNTRLRYARILAKNGAAWLHAPRGR